MFYVVVNYPPTVLRQQRSVIPVTSGAPVTTSGAPVITSGKKQSQGKHQGEKRYLYTYLTK